MRNLLLTLLLVLPAALFAQSIDFSGDWKIDKARTEFGKAPEWILPYSFEVSQSADQITIKRKITDAQQALHEYSEALLFNGQLTETKIEYSGLDRRAKVNWTEDKKGLIVFSESFKDGAPASRITETWTLDDGGKTLIVDKKTEQADGNTYSIKSFYTKK